MQQNSINIVHLAIALLCVTIIATIAVVVSQASRPMGHPHTRSTQLRGVHQGMVIYAQSNKTYFPGLGPDGEEDTQVFEWGDGDEAEIPPIQAGLSVDKRFAILLHGDYLTPEYLISPSEADPNIVSWPGEGTITTGHYSYAMLQIPSEGGRHTEWSETLNSQAVVVSDRNTGAPDDPSSVHVERGEPWAGSVLWNDNHVDFETEDWFETKYGGGDLNEADQLFESNGTDDALMIHTGN